MNRGPLQFVRELTKNSIEAIQRCPGKPGTITWDVDWTIRNLSGYWKLAITDTGDGMTGEELVKYINALSSSYASQTIDGNYGIGAKISTVTRNHAGVRYLSWKANDEDGASVVLWKDPITSNYGLKQLKGPNDQYGHWTYVEDDVKPDQIKSHGGHGTKVILHGNAESEDTVEAPEGAHSPSRWVAYYLNNRFFSIPEGITIRAREGWENPPDNHDTNLLRTVRGMEPYLTQHSESHGSVDLTGCTVRWWILREEGALSQNSGWINSSGHIGALYQDELYETLVGSAGHHRLQQFGILFGSRRVVIYIEPETDAVTTNTSRTNLLLDHEPLPWTVWAEEFRNNLPIEIGEFQLAISDGPADSDKSHSILKRLELIKDLYRVSRYRPHAQGKLFISESQSNYGGTYTGHGTSKPTSTTSTKNHSNGTGLFGGDVYVLFSSGTQKKGEETEPNPFQFPKVQWISVEDGTREIDDLSDRAARFHRDQNMLLINGDFRVFADMESSWTGKLKAAGVPNSCAVVKEVVREWFEQSLIESILGVQQLVGSKEWNDQDLDDALSEEALTAAVMPRYHVNNSVRRAMGTKFGKGL